MSMGGSGIGARELEAFQHEVEQHLGVSGTLTAFGVSRVLHVDLRGRHVDIGTNGSYLWVIADLRWTNFPEGALLSYAPEDSYRRGKMMEDGSIPAETGEPSFDHAYLLLGLGAAEAAAALPAQVRVALLEFADLRPEIRGQEIGGDPLRAVRRVHIRSEPDLRANPHSSYFVRLGTEHFTPEHAATTAQRLTKCAEALEAGLV
jgi:hypothetical protein